MVEDSLAKYFIGPAASLESHACGASLEELGFVRTSVVTYGDHVVVAFVEPQDSARVRSAQPHFVARSLPPEWQDALRPFVDSASQRFQYSQFSLVTQFSPYYERGETNRVLPITERHGVTKAHLTLWPFLAKHKAAADQSIALSILAQDSSVLHRVFALSVLQAFSANDTVWAAVTRALRDPADIVAMMAGNVMLAWSQTATRVVDWTPMQDDLRILLGGGNLWVLPQLMETLVQTQVSPVLAKRLLKDNDTYVMGYAALNDVPSAYTAARQLLAQLSGKDFGDEVERWRAWIQKL